MSDPTYRIEIEHTPGEAYPFYGRVYLLSDDGYPVYAAHREDRESLRRQLRDWVEEQNVKQETEVFYLDSEARNAEPPHSVKAS